MADDGKTQVQIEIGHVQQILFERSRLPMKHQWQRVRESNPLLAFRENVRFCRKLAVISALTTQCTNHRFARIAQIYAVSVSEFVRKPRACVRVQDLIFSASLDFA